MTDIFIVDEHGRFAVGKAPTTKFEESIGCMEASEDAFWTWELDFTASAKELSAPFDNVVYAGTSMLNALITRSGERLGLIITKGFERTLLQGAPRTRSRAICSRMWST